MQNIEIKGACEHNLKNINLKIPRNKITAIIGVSGSGKSTLCYDIIHAQSQIEFLNSINLFIAKFFKKTQKPKVKSIKNLSPTISIDQKRLRPNPRSTLGTTTQIYTYLRLLFSRFGSLKLDAKDFSFNNPKGACKKCKGIGKEYKIDPKSVLDYEKSLSQGASKVNLFKPKSRYYKIIELSKKIDVNKKIKNYTQKELDFLLYSPKINLSNNSKDFVQNFSHRGIIVALEERAKDKRGQSETKKKKEGIFWIIKKCSECNGSKLDKKVLKSLINGKNIGDFSNMQLTELVKEISKIKDKNAKPLIDKILEHTQYLIDVNLGYLSLNRGIDSLSGGENQRLKLARELGSNLIEMIYILDEPTSGLHPKDRENMIKIIKGLSQENKNTIILIEHNSQVIKEADYIIEIGEKGGILGGNIIAKGSLNEIISNKNSLTSKFLNKDKNLILKKKLREKKGFLKIRNANANNLKNINLDIPLGVFCSITGVSGSGKSSLIKEELVKLENKDLVVVDQKPIEGSSRGNCATYIGIFDLIRDLFAKENNISKSLFSFNGEGACLECMGKGFIKTDMHFMEDFKSVCESCLGNRYKKEILDFKFRDKNIVDVLNFSVDEALIFFNDFENIKKRLKILVDVGLGYLTLGQSHDSYSGGEAQRLKLANSLHKTGKVYILDEPTSGLHYLDVENLLFLLNDLIDKGNSVIVIEHNLNVIAQSDWIIDLGPLGADKGGEVVFEGFPKDILNCKKSFTGIFLKKSLKF